MTDDRPSSDEVFQNPVDGRTYVAPGGWSEHSPDEGRTPERAGGITLGSVTLLAAEAEIERQTSTEDLGAFIQEVVRLAEEPLCNSGKPFQVMVQFTCRPDGHEVEIAFHGEAPQERLQQYFDALVAAKRLPVSHGELPFLVELSVDP